MLPTSAPTLPETLPTLRQDIKIEEGGIDFNGKPTWVIQDLSNGHFFHIGWQEHEMLSHWRSSKSTDYLKTLKKKSLADISEQTLIDFILFLSQNFLIEQPFLLMQEKNNERLKKQNSTHWFIVLAKTYLFFRIPLIKPNDFLNKSYPYFSWLFNKTFVTFMAIFFLVTLTVLSQSWHAYHTTFFQVTGISFFAFYFGSLAIAKVAHEFGHAFACKRYQLNVASMGVAFLVMFPMLYTDTSESWKIKDPKARIIVPLAGVWVEFCLAILAFWCWLFLNDGPLKSVCFFLSSYSLLTTLLINISPFLRFDGYHVLSDLLGMRNLQTRAFALANWWSREKLFNFNLEPPEYFTHKKLKMVLLYALITWVYRFVLFMGIALLVYYLFFKVLGIILFVIEIIYFILAPIASEMAVWWKMRKQMTLNRNSIATATVACLSLLMLFIPWQTTVSLPATLSLKNKIIFTKDAAQVEAVFIKQGEEVQKNQRLAKLHSPELSHQLKRNELKTKRT